MSEYVSYESIKSFFTLLQEHCIEYVLLRNNDEELPNQLIKTKDVDIIVMPSHAKKLHRLLLSNGWKNGKHPWDFADNFVFLYSMTPFKMYSKNGLNIDVCYELACRSANRGEWIPLDQTIQNSVWQNRRVENDSAWKYRLSYEDELVHLLTRCIFDKKQFTTAYRQEIEKLLKLVSDTELDRRMSMVFFKFTPFLKELLSCKAYDDICVSYIEFSDY